MTNTTYKKPTFFQSMFGVILTMITEKFFTKSHRVYSHIGKYKLVKEIVKDNPFKKYTTGIYKQGNKKVFIKTWHGKIRDLNYYKLINQSTMHTILQEKIEKSHAKIRIPKLIDSIKKQDSLSLVFEYIEGENLKKFPVSKQARVLKEIITELRRVQAVLTPKEQKQFIKRSYMFYLTTFPVFAYLACACDIKYSYVFARIFFKSLSLMMSFYTKNLVLSHRDLNLENIAQTRQGLYLLDNETMAITHPAFDVSYIEVGSDFQHLPKNMFENFHTSSDAFLKNYILFQLASDPSNPPGYKKYFVNKLKEINNL